MLFLVALILIGSVSTVSAQTSWWRTYGGTSGENGFSVQQTIDGGFVIAGYTRSFGAGPYDAYLVKTDDRGDTLWTRTYGGANSDEGQEVQQTIDGGYIFVGYTNSHGAGAHDVYLVRTNASGDTLWTRVYGGTGDDYGYSVQQTLDGGYVIAGSTISFGRERYDVYLIRTDASGDTLWTRTYGGTQTDEGRSVQMTTDGGYVIAGYTGSSGAGATDVYLIKTNACGNTLWTRSYGGTSDDYGYSVQRTTDGGYIVTGYTFSLGAGYADVYLVKTNASGDTLWTRTYGGAAFDLGYSVKQTADGGYIIGGCTNSFGPGTPYFNVYLIKTDAEGDTLWTRAYGGANDDWAYSVTETTDRGCITAGYTHSFGAGDDDFYLIKTDSLGNVGVVEGSPKPRVMRGRIGTTVLSGASGVRQLASCVAFDAMGRRVHHPEPGIYFVKEPKAQAQAPAVQKVLLVR